MEKVYGGNDLPKSLVFSSEWKTERVREDASGDREDGEEGSTAPGATSLRDDTLMKFAVESTRTLD